MLRISDAFEYDDKSGEYKPKTEVGLSGWCDPCKSKDEALCGDTKKDSVPPR
jgi:hypothetical protein